MTQTTPPGDATRRSGVPRPPNLSRPVRDSLQFFGTFLRRPRTVGALLPSSRQLATALAGGLDARPGDVVVEYGCGTGPVTQVIAESLPEGVRYLGIERDPGFHRRLSARFPYLDFHCGSVENVERILAERGLPAVKVIVSGLPFASLPETVQRRVVVGTRRVLRDDGEFRTFQYVHAYGLPAAQRFRRQMSTRFSHYERSRAVVRNVPPAYILTFRP